ncbi:hypothetical protein PHACT_14095 [Pseudohongiella acticola]|uniref:Glycosyltransferase RgtA/B/C/D-like domain-containing protein n=1 Tax=Pseudohongiella acticola TaxID=1524254 RepID=A0A1E8CHC0_9GAMM|nr:glycosyltransferase family 39 protein [Pseudohongiella acticola]OFE11647.1 hypothetical protein PHACT_14095 [Pseudohongiella acticola]
MPTQRIEALNQPAQRALIILVSLALLTTAIKIFLATRLELYSDEIFYWQSWQFPAFAYSDLPFMAALLAGTGAELLGHHAIAVRAIFLVMGCSVPMLVYWLARPLTSQQQALTSAVLTFCLPMAAFLGLLAVPDVPLIFWGLLFIGSLERATRKGQWRWWLFAGLTAALGLSTHYRFSLYVLAALIFMLLSRSHWHYWRSGRLWLAGVIAATGLYPALSFNLVHDLSGLDYHLLSRHPWQFQIEGLLHPFIQATIVTPLMYALLWFTLWQLLQKARAGDTRAGLFAAFAATNLGVYLLLAPWSDTTRTTLHWPLSGYVPLLVFAPLALSSVKTWLNARWQPQRGRRIVRVIPLTGLVGTLLLFIGIGSQGFNQQLQALIGTGVLSNKMAGWQPLTEHVGTLQRTQGLPSDTLIVSDNYYTSAQIAFALPAARAFTIDQDKTIRDGRYAQYAIWQKDEAGLRQLEGEQALFITEDSTLDINEKLAVMDRACSLFEELTLLNQLFLYQGDKIFSFYLGRNIQAGAGDSGTDCPKPSHLWLDQPEDDAVISGQQAVSGWATNTNMGVGSIRILLNGNVVGETQRSIARNDVVDIRGAHDDPGAPNLGFEFVLDTSQFANGRYQLALEVVSGAGERQRGALRQITITNP